MKKNIFKLFSSYGGIYYGTDRLYRRDFPENSTATSEQIGASASALEAAINGLAITDGARLSGVWKANSRN